MGLSRRQCDDLNSDIEQMPSSVSVWSDPPARVSVSISEGRDASKFPRFDVSFFLRILKSLKTKHVAFVTLMLTSTVGGKTLNSDSLF